MMTTDIDEKKEAAGEIKDAAVDQATSAAASAKDLAEQVVATAKDEAHHLVAETKNHAGALLEESRQQVDEQAKIQRDRLVGTLQTVGDDLEQMAAGAQNGLAADLARQVADRTRRLSSSLGSREPSDLLGELRTFAQRKPGTFLLGALAAGVVAGRLLRGAKEDAPAGPRSSSSGASPSGAADPVPTANVPTSPAVTSAAAVPTQTGALSSDTPLGGDGS